MMRVWWTLKDFVELVFEQTAGLMMRRRADRIRNDRDLTAEGLFFRLKEQYPNRMVRWVGRVWMD
jgi:hypothetical protein